MKATDPGANPINFEDFRRRGQSAAEFEEAKTVQEAKLARLRDMFLERRLNALRKFGQQTEIHFKYNNGSAQVEL